MEDNLKNNVYMNNSNTKNSTFWNLVMFIF